MRDIDTMSISLYKNDETEVPIVTCARCRQDSVNINSHYGIMFCDACMLPPSNIITVLPDPHSSKAWTRPMCSSVNTFVIRYGPDTDIRNVDDLRKLLSDDLCTPCAK